MLAEGELADDIADIGEIHVVLSGNRARLVKVCELPVERRNDSFQPLGARCKALKRERSLLDLVGLGVSSIVKDTDCMAPAKEPECGGTVHHRRGPETASAEAGDFSDSEDALSGSFKGHISALDLVEVATLAGRLNERNILNE